MTKIHLDTDIGGDMDDLCALAMLLKWPDLDHPSHNLDSFLPPIRDV
ncbi:MAG: hypothetical protein M3Z24_14260 [Chloroflexota bacterium]|nr:hypothetical protein [Chloroflexota bacterium]